jgi:hypothetical protein
MKSNLGLYRPGTGLAADKAQVTEAAIEHYRVFSRGALLRNCPSHFLKFSLVYQMALVADMLQKKINRHKNINGNRNKTNKAPSAVQLSLY